MVVVGYDSIGDVQSQSSPRSQSQSVVVITIAVAVCVCCPWVESRQWQNHWNLGAAMGDVGGVRVQVVGGCVEE